MVCIKTCTWKQVFVTQKSLKINVVVREVSGVQWHAWGHLVIDRNGPIVAQGVLFSSLPVCLCTVPRSPSLPGCSHSEALLGQLFQGGDYLHFCLLCSLRDLFPSQEQPLRDSPSGLIELWDSSIYGLSSFSLILYLVEKDIFTCCLPQNILYMVSEYLLNFHSVFYSSR